MAAPPPEEAIATLLGPSTQITRRVDIYEEDGTTAFMLDAPLLEGSVSVDGSRDERRTLDCVLDNRDGSLDNYPGGFWYDKVIKVYRGIEWYGLSPSKLRLGPGEVIPATEEPLDWDGDPLDWDGDPLTWGAETGAADAYLRTADSTSQELLLGNMITLIVKMSMDIWTPDAPQTIASKWDTGQQAWKFQVLTDGKLSAVHSTNGTNTATMDSTVPTGFADGSEHWIKIDSLCANGFSGKTTFFYTSEDGVVWTQLGDGVTNAVLGGGDYFDSTTSLRIGATGLGEYLVGTLSTLKIMDHDRAMVDLDFTHMDPDAQAMTDANGTPFQILGNTWFVLGGETVLKSWETQLGEFLVEKIDSKNFPHQVAVTGRDYTKKLMEGQFDEATSFAETQSPEAVIKAIASAAGITKFILPVTGKTLGKVFTFDGESQRWAAIEDIAIAFGHEVYMDAQGYMVMREYKDPAVSPVVFTFQTGPEGSLASYSKSSSDARVYNRVVVRSESASGLPRVVVVENHEPSSPTSIENLGRAKTYNYSSGFFAEGIEGEKQMQATAESFLAVMALESYDVNLSAIVIPWLEATEIVEFIDPEPNPDDPTRFLLVSFNIPLKLGTMSATTRRVRVVG